LAAAKAFLAYRFFLASILFCAFCILLRRAAMARALRDWALALAAMYSLLAVRLARLIFALNQRCFCLHFFIATRAALASLVATLM
jgi:hypothetical protein